MGAEQKAEIIRILITYVVPVLLGSIVPIISTISARKNERVRANGDYVESFASGYSKLVADLRKEFDEYKKETTQEIDELRSEISVLRDGVMVLTKQVYELGAVPAFSLPKK